MSNYTNIVLTVEDKNGKNVFSNGALTTGTLEPKDFSGGAVITLFNENGGAFQTWVVTTDYETKSIPLFQIFEGSVTANALDAENYNLGQSVNLYIQENNFVYGS